MGLFVVLLAILVLIAPFVLTFWILGSVGLYSLANRRGISHPWLAWIPIASNYTMGALCDQYSYTVTGKAYRFRVLLPVLQVLPFLVNGILIPFLSFTALLVPLLLLAYVVLHFVCLYGIYSSCCPDSKVAMLIASIVLPFLPSIFIFANRKSDAGLLMYAQGVEPDFVEPQPFTEENSYGE